LDVGLDGVHDSDVLAWAARERRVVVTRDVNTMIGFAWDRIRDGLPMLGLIAIRPSVPIARAIDEVVLLALAGEEGDLEGQVVYVSLAE